MKVFYYLTAVAFLLACVSGILFLQTLLPPSPGDSLVSNVRQIKHGFEAEAQPLAVLNLERLQQQALISPELVDPKLTLPQTSHYPYSEIQPLQQYTDNCGKIPNLTFHSPALQKAFIWAKFHCGVITTLPSNFFTSKPFMHPSGKSYALLAHQTPSLKTIEDVNRSFHLSELLNQAKFQSPTLDLSPWQLQLLINGEDQVINEDFVFLLSSSGLINQNKLYVLYPTKNWMHYLSRQKLTVIFGARTQACLLMEGNACWIENPNYKILNIRLITGLLLIVFVIWAGVLASMLIRRARWQKRLAAERLFTLQMLTHELRTPTAALRLSIEAFRKNYDELPETSQQAFLQMCEELQRLNRVVDASKTYLSDDATQSEIHLNEFAKTIIQSYNRAIAFTPLSVDLMMTVNAYWLELCIRNFIDNAFHHGKSPVSVILSLDSRHVSIQVQDQGSPIFDSLNEMITPFRKAENSKGLGLGLAITKKMIQSMNGELIFQPSPTRFNLHLRTP
jgi:signal transduction histidine kinase